MKHASNTMANGEKNYTLSISALNDDDRREAIRSWRECPQGTQTAVRRPLGYRNWPFDFAVRAMSDDDPASTILNIFLIPTDADFDDIKAQYFKRFLAWRSRQRRTQPELRHPLLEGFNSIFCTSCGITPHRFSLQQDYGYQDDELFETGFVRYYSPGHRISANGEISSWITLADSILSGNVLGALNRRAANRDVNTAEKLPVRVLLDQDLVNANAQKRGVMTFVHYMNRAGHEIETGPVAVNSEFFRDTDNRPRVVVVGDTKYFELQKSLSSLREKDSNSFLKLDPPVSPVFISVDDEECAEHWGTNYHSPDHPIVLADLIWDAALAAQEQGG